MKKSAFILCLMLACGAHGWPGSVEMRTVPAGNIPVSIRPGLMGDSGVAAANLNTSGNVAQVAADLGLATTNVTGNIYTLSDVTNSYLLNVGTFIYTFSYMTNSRPAYNGDVYRVYYDSTKWIHNRTGTGNSRTNASSSFLPPVSGWCYTSDGTPVDPEDLSLQFFSGVDAKQQAQIDSKVSTNTVRMTGTLFDNGTNLFFIIGTTTNKITNN